MIELTVKQLRSAANIKERIGKLETELNRLLGIGSTLTGNGRRKRRKMSAAARAKIAAAQRARWAKHRANKKA